MHIRSHLSNQNHCNSTTYSSKKSTDSANDILELIIIGLWFFERILDNQNTRKCQKCSYPIKFSYFLFQKNPGKDCSKNRYSPVDDAWLRQRYQHNRCYLKGIANHSNDSPENERCSMLLRDIEWVFVEILKWKELHGYHDPRCPVHCLIRRNIRISKQIFLQVLNNSWANAWYKHTQYPFYTVKSLNLRRTLLNEKLNNINYSYF